MVAWHVGQSSQKRRCHPDPDHMVWRVQPVGSSRPYLSNMYGQSCRCGLPLWTSSLNLQPRYYQKRRSDVLPELTKNGKYDCHPHTMANASSLDRPGHCRVVICSFVLGDEDPLPLSPVLTSFNSTIMEMCERVIHEIEIAFA